MTGVQLHGKYQVILKANIDYQITYEQAHKHDFVGLVRQTEKGTIKILLDNPGCSPILIFPNGKVQISVISEEEEAEVRGQLRDVLVPMDKEDLHLEIVKRVGILEDWWFIYQGMKRAERLVHPVRRPRPDDLILRLPSLPSGTLTGLLLEVSIHSFLLDTYEDSLMLVNSVRQTLDNIYKGLQEFLTPVIESERIIELMVEQVEQTWVFWEKCREVVTFHQEYQQVLPKAVLFQSLIPA